MEPFLHNLGMPNLLPSYVQIGVTRYPIEGHGVGMDSALECAVVDRCYSEWRQGGC